MLYNAIKEAKNMYTVKEVAEILGVSAHTVRYYDGPISIHPVVRMIYFLNRSFYRLFLPEIICLMIFKIVIICIRTDMEFS